MSNIPIRLVHQNGDITELMATDVALDVEMQVLRLLMQQLIFLFHINRVQKVPLLRNLG